jgi:hypothetical protein
MATSPLLHAFGGHTMIVDHSGTYAPLGLADLLLSRGVKVTFVTDNAALGHVASAELELQHILPRLERAGMVSIIGHRVARTWRRIVALEPVLGGPVRDLLDVDSIVYSVLRIPSNRLWAQLQGAHADVRCIGDAASPRSTATVIVEAEELARTI